MTQTLNDITYMQRAIELARLGRFTTAPNPNVGCVIVKQGQIVGEGFHYRAGEAHAEIHALKMAGEQAKQSTVYVTLEPCSHFGKTPPCANALVKAGVERVVIAMQDPNPAVSGNGIKILESAGIQVKCGVLSSEAEKLNKGFFKRMRTGLPYVQLKLAASLDGKTAMASGESQWITSSQSRQDVQNYRAQSSAILSTSSTVLADNPSLTVRWHELPQTVKDIYPESDLRQPIRVILDKNNRLTMQEKLFTLSGDIWLVRKNHLVENQSEVDNNTTQILIEGSEESKVNLHDLMLMLGRQQINHIWVEAGANLAGALIEENLVDELIIYIAPKLLGHHARDLCVLPNLSLLANAPEFEFVDVTPIGPDLRLTLRKLSP